jgi:hypothetical protein
MDCPFPVLTLWARDKYGSHAEHERAAVGLEVETTTYRERMHLLCQDREQVK